MKLCPYCNRNNEDTAERCKFCFAGFPKEEPKKPEQAEEKTEPVRRKHR